MCYVKDCARAIALLQLTPRLSHRASNIASGTVDQPESRRRRKKLVPDAQIELPEPRSPAGPGADLCLDISRLRQDTGCQPAWDTERSVADCIARLRQGHDR